MKNQTLRMSAALAGAIVAMTAVAPAAAAGEQTAAGRGGNACACTHCAIERHADSAAAAVRQKAEPGWRQADVRATDGKTLAVRQKAEPGWRQFTGTWPKTAGTASALTKAEPGWRTAPAGRQAPAAGNLMAGCLAGCVCLTTP